ncbi:MAG: DUF302 domain-containing protein [Promethearchaeota archaeon]
MADYLKKEVDMDFDDAVAKVEKLAVEEGFSIMLKKDIDKILKTKLGLETYPRYTSILACIASFAKEALDISWKVALLFPCSFLVFEEEGKVVIAHTSTMSMAVELGFADADAMKPVIKKVKAAVQKLWDRI